MDLVLCHRIADFDALGAAVGIARLHPGTRIVLCGGTHPAVKEFLALYRDEFPLIEQRSVRPDRIRSITIVDAQSLALLGKAADWVTQPRVKVSLWDHHPQGDRDIPTQDCHIESVGATTTLIVEQLQPLGVSLSVADLTVMALGIHVDTGSLTFDHATPRDAAALAWLMAQGANQRAIATYIEPGFSPQLQELLVDVLADLQTETVHGYRIAWVLLQTPHYVPGLSSLASQLVVLSESDVVILAHGYHIYRGPAAQEANGTARLTLIGRSRLDELDLSELLTPLGGGGHPQAAAATLRTQTPQSVLTELIATLRDAIPQPPTARELMSSPVRTIRPETTIDQARRILLRYGHSGLSVVDAEGTLMGILSRRDLDVALHHGFGHAPVKGYMTSPVTTITPTTPLPDIETLMVTQDIGRLPVLDDQTLVGIVTRTDILRQLHQHKDSQARSRQAVVRHSIRRRLEGAIAPPLQQLLAIAAQSAENRGWHLYLVGGAVRDLLLAPPDQPVPFREFDLVVDGVATLDLHGAGEGLARALQLAFPEAQLQVFGQFQTAALIWHAESQLGAFSVDIATARSEFYPYPAANPEVEASSIRQDLYRRDFTVNALAVRLTSQRRGPANGEELLDFFGGMDDLAQRRIRVLHPNSFIEDPTRIFRAIRFAARLEFQLGPQTEIYLRHAIASGIYAQTMEANAKAPALQTRLRNELKYILQEPHWREALTLIQTYGAFQCLHPALQLTSVEWRQIHLVLGWHHALKLDPEQQHRWIRILEVLLLSLPALDRQRVAQQLQLPEASQRYLQEIDGAIAHLTPLFLTQPTASVVVAAVQGIAVPTLILVAAQATVPIRRMIWAYLTQWRLVKPFLDGQDLIRLGYKPGQQFREMLALVLAATLDGTIGDRAEAEALLRDCYHDPQSVIFEPGELE